MRAPPGRRVLSRIGTVCGDARAGPFALVAIAVGFGLVTLRSEMLSVAYPNDEAVHSLMVRFAMDQWRAGHLPFSGWFPYLSVGSPYLLHYQSTPAVVTGLAATVLGAKVAFGWSQYLLLASWPVSVYLGSRLLGWDRWIAAIAAGGAPVLVSVAGYGFGPQAYLWIGNGLWSQLWGMWLFPLVLGLSWQAVARGRRVGLAGLSLAAIITCHFLTAYLAGLAIVVWVLLRPTEAFTRLRRAAGVTAIGLLASAWVTIPLVVENRWAAVNELQVGTFWVDSYGAGKVLGWLVGGNLFDHGRLPVLSVLAAIGLVTCAMRARRDEPARAILGLFFVSLALYVGRPTLGPLLDILPFGSFLLLHRYVMGVQLAGLVLAGVGGRVVGLEAVRLAPVLAGRLRWRGRGAGHGAGRVPGPGAGPGPGPSGQGGGQPGWRGVGVALVAVVTVVAVLSPGWTEVAGYEHASAVGIRYQQGADGTAGANVTTLVDIAGNLGGGRIYAGLPSNWGVDFMVGEVPVYIYLAEHGDPSIGFTERTSSLMSGPEVDFDEAVAGDYPLFGIHYLLLPLGHPPPVAAHLVAAAGSYTLWTVGVAGYVQVVDTSGTIRANEADLGAATERLLTRVSTVPDYPTVAFDGQPAAVGTLAPGSAPVGQPGTVVTERDNLAGGIVSATVRTKRTAVVLLKASFDPGWTVTVDGTATSDEMVAPALVGVVVPPGTHRVVFVYKGFQGYPALFVLALVSLVVGFASPEARRRLAARRGARRGAEDGTR